MNENTMKTISVAGDRVTLLLTAADTRGRYTVMEATLPPNAGPPPHVHSREDETFLVLSGEVTFYVGKETRLLKPGEFLSGIPPKTEYLCGEHRDDAAKVIWVSNAQAWPKTE